MNNQQRAHTYVPASLFKRSDRIVIDDNGYYYKTREGGITGPFITEAKTLFDLNIFILTTEVELELGQSNPSFAA